MRLTLVATALLACAQMIGAADVASTKAAPGPLTSAFAVGVLTRAFDRQSSTWGPRHLAATLWYPASLEPLAGDRQAIADAPPSQRGPFPLIVYSHGGCGGSPEAIAPLAVTIASAGFVFVQFHIPDQRRTTVSRKARVTRAACSSDPMISSTSSIRSDA